ncbi:hypothetical protein ACIQUQ_24300 [Streptomyces sp. NPDC101118]|uniref:hypothetical protein n=1 Tax=Streptomyces sp. NPDC101118 TaxID=3366109 RepID=UPI0038251F8E
MATNFEGHSHDALLAMLASADAATAKSLGTQLTEAAKTIKEIGEDLKAHAPKVAWEGEGGDAFREWVNATGNATLRLGEYSATGGTWMTNAAQTIVEVKANMPQRDKAAAANLEAANDAPNDPDSDQIARDARTKLNGDHATAVQQMTKLAQSYEASSLEMNRAEPPTFPPPPDRFVPTDSRGFQEVQRPGGSYGGGTGGNGGTGGSGYVPPKNDGGGDTPPPPVPESPTPSPQPNAPTPVTPDARTPVIPDRDNDPRLDSVAPPIERKAPPVTTLPPVVNPPNGGGPLPNVPTPPPLVLPPNGIKPGGGGPGLPPGGGIRQTPPPVMGGGPGGPGGRFGGPGLTPGPRDPGIMGGRQVPVSRTPAAGIPRGTVIGETGGGQTGRSPGGFMGGAGGHGGGQGASPVGRRLASEPGGVYGRQQAAGSASGRPFTQGGSGLVRGQSNGQPDEREERRGHRPDYLAEDEETWQSGNRRVVPPVID